MTRQPFLFRWQRAVILDDCLSTADRHLALTLSLHMDLDGANAYPSIRVLSAETRRKRNTVVASVNTLEKCGWLKVKRGGIGLKRDVNRYTASYPQGYLSARGISTRRGALKVSEEIQELPRSSRRAPKKVAAAVCGECEISGRHSDDCSLKDAA
jgi:hypothetical protein